MGGILFDPHGHQQPLFAPRSLIIRFVDGTLHNDAKKFVEHLGLAVRGENFFWTKRHTLQTTTPDDNMDGWIAKLYASPLIRFVEKVRFSYPAET